MKPTVVVLMSTYNGSKFLEEQVKSILNQEDVNVKLVVRDDGSTDSTIEILSKYPIFKLIKGDNIGCEASFLKLLCEKIKGDYYAFADQDDIWFPNKLAISIQELCMNSNQPCLFCANQIITNGELKEKGLMITESKYEQTYKHMELNFFSNRHGCTMVWNNSLQQISLYLSDKISFIPRHDVWLNLIARCVGNVVLGKIPLQYYRIHSSNTAGLASGKYSRFKKGVNIYWKNDFKRNLYAQACVKYLNNFINDSYGWKYVKMVSVYRNSIFKCMRVAFSKAIWDTKKIDCAFFSISVLINKY